MGRYSSDPGTSTYTPAPVGTHLARCYSIIDIGTQHGEYQGKPNRRNQIVVSWELPDELISVGNDMKPVVTSKFYTNSLSEKATLRQDLENWRGKAFTEDELDKFDLENILGKPCMITVVTKENGKTKVSGVTGLPKGVECGPQVNKSFTFWLDEFDEDKFNGLSDGLKDIIKKSEEYAMASNGGQQAPSRMVDEDDQIPF